VGSAFQAEMKAFASIAAGTSARHSVGILGGDALRSRELLFNAVLLFHTIVLLDTTEHYTTDLVQYAASLRCTVLPLRDVLVVRTKYKDGHRPSSGRKPTSLNCTLPSIPEGYTAVDIGEQTVAQAVHVCSAPGVENVVWFSTHPSHAACVALMGVEGTNTRRLLHAVCSLHKDSVNVILSGTDLVDFSLQLGISDRVRHVSTGHAVVLEILKGRTLPLLKCIQNIVK